MTTNIEKLKKRLQDLKNTPLDEQKKVEANELALLLDEVAKGLTYDALASQNLRNDFEKSIKDLRKDMLDAVKMAPHETMPYFEKLNARIDELATKFTALREANEKIGDEMTKPVELKQPSWFKQFSDSKILNAFDTLREHIALGFQDVAAKIIAKAYDFSIHQSPERPLAVKLVDLDGRFYKAKGGGYGSTMAGSASTQLSGYSRIVAFNGTVVTAGTPVRISATAISCKKVVIQAGENAGLICVGDVNVSASTRTGRVIYPTNEAEFSVDDVSLLYIDAAGDGYTFNGYYLV